ncbi:CsxC family protein [Desulfosporosinus sp. FKA]|uniref:CsxC family protein n=1 Tax=Desulfosporosinus sp. FKA TaxID=1969834 RepID=UPI000B49E80A|nr:hypothetical protein [Desulfosporosinus sp. FKA]
MCECYSSIVKIPKPYSIPAQAFNSNDLTSSSLIEPVDQPQSNPSFPITATLPVYRPMAVTQTGNTVFVTVSIPAESSITLPEQALQIKKVSKDLKITQCRFFNAIPAIVAGKPADTPKLFLGGFVRKDIQYANVTKLSASTVEGQIKDFVVDIPILGVIDLGNHLNVPSVLFDDQQVYQYLKTLPLPSGFAGKDRLMAGDMSEFNVMSNKFMNKLPACELIYSQINEMDDAVDRVPLHGGPFEEGIFTTLQEKMVIVIQVILTFEPVVDPCRH